MRCEVSGCAEYSSVNFACVAYGGVAKRGAKFNHVDPITPSWTPIPFFLTL